MSSWRLVAFDLDGTLVDSAPDLAYCLGDALDSVGFNRPSPADARRWIGDGVEMLVRRALTAAGNPPDAALLDQALAAFRQCYRGRLFVASCLYPGVSETLPKLQVAGLTLGCVTNKPEGFARDLLDQAGISAYFDFVYGADSFATRKPSPEPLLKAAERFDISPRQSVMVGDSPNDLESARSAGFDFVYAAYGYGAPDDPALAACATVIESFSALHRLLCRS